jgi:tripartite-type tricarboxylate transporter receptor subunit TctC
MMRKKSIALLTALMACLGLAATESPAQTEYPSRPVRIIVGFVPGGGTDILARLLGQKLDESFGQQRVIVENRPGASQVVASELVARSAPDGYTLIMVSAAFTVTPALRQKLPFDTVRDFAPIVMVARAPNILVIHPSIPARSVQHLIALARTRPGQLTFGSSGVGTPSHLSGVLLGVLGKFEVTHIPYKGVGQAFIDVLSGHIQMLFPTISSAIPYIKSGKLIALGVTTPQRSALAPGIPTIAESGLPGFEANSWFGLLGPAGTPRPIVARLNESVVRALKDQAVRDTITQLGADAVGGSPEEFAATISTELVKWKKLAETGGIKPE